MKQRRIIITGGSSGMGYAIARLLLRHDHNVYILSRKAETCDLVQGQKCEGINIDVKDTRQIEKAKVWVEKRLQGSFIDLLINCSGIGYEKSLSDITENDYFTLFDTNVKGTIFVTKIFLPLIKNQTGIICNFSSIAGIKGFANWSLYCASKFAVEGFTQSIRHEVRPLGIRVMSVRPGSVDTPFYSNLKHEEKKDFIHPETVAKIVVDALDMEKNAIIEDVFINNAVGDL